ncbi:MAG: undecaprenyl diphosphate synthase family protein [Methanosarcinaceae archaeon]|jgi:undecaprenyl diphosphate synthase|nr:undecaprenyl diphosphate synthase family protein [Methanosarcinaceae archaeon]NKQ37929.1 undecaprenyl diphosphate synthase family protein [Methanosarcinales archaeon]
MNIIEYIYGLILSKKIKSGINPTHVTLVLSDSDLFDKKGILKLNSFVLWCKQFNISIISIYVNLIKNDCKIKKKSALKLINNINDSFLNLPNDIGFKLYDDEGLLKESREDRSLLIYMMVGFGGKKEITNAVKSIISNVKSKKIEPKDIDEKIIKSHLLIKNEPDMIIRVGGKCLSDFLIWQSIYSELFFTDVNWDCIRKVDIMRIFRDYGNRQRRFGK